MTERVSKFSSVSVDEYSAVQEDLNSEEVVETTDNSRLIKKIVIPLAICAVLLPAVIIVANVSKGHQSSTDLAQTSQMADEAVDNSDLSSYATTENVSTGIGGYFENDTHAEQANLLYGLDSRAEDKEIEKCPKGQHINGDGRCEDGEDLKPEPTDVANPGPTSSPTQIVVPDYTQQANPNASSSGSSGVSSAPKANSSPKKEKKQVPKPEKAEKSTLTQFND
jgi:hypothetical protein